LQNQEKFGKPDAWKLARPVWGWGRGATPRSTPPMCLSAIHWAGIRVLFFGADRYDAAVGRFDETFIYQLMDGTADSPLLHPIIVDQKECADLFTEWNAKSDRVMY